MNTDVSSLTVDEFFDKIDEAINTLEASGVVLADICIVLEGYNIDSNIITFRGKSLQVDKNVSSLTVDEFFDKVDEIVKELVSLGISLNDIRIDLENYDVNSNITVKKPQADDASSLDDLTDRLYKAEQVRRARELRKRVEYLEERERREAKKEAEVKAFMVAHNRKKDSIVGNISIGEWVLVLVLFIGFLLMIKLI